MNKFISSVASVAIAFSVAAHAETAEMSKIQVDGLNSEKTTAQSLGNSLVNVVINTGNLVIALNNNMEKLPEGIRNKGAELQKCIEDNYNEFKDFTGDRATTVVMCHAAFGLESVALVVQKAGNGALKITAVGADALKDFGNSLLADLPTIVEHMADKDLVRIPGFWALQLGYVITAGAVGGVAVITGEMIQLAVDAAGTGLELAVNGVKFGIKVAHKAAIYVVHYSLEAGKEVGKRVVLVVDDVFTSVVDTYATLQCTAAHGAKAIGKAGINGLGKLLGQKPRKEQGNACDVSRAGADAVRIAATIITLPIRVLTNETWEEMKANAHAPTKQYSNYYDTRGN